MRLIGYIRVSTEAQAESGLGIEAQEERIRSYCKLFEHDLIGVEVDAGVSGSTLNREGLEAMLTRLKKSGDVDGVIVAKLDRLTRSVKDFAILLENYFESQFRLVSISEQIDTSTATGELVLNVLIAISQWERKVIGERTAKALERKRARGEYTGGGTPYGYALDDDGVNLIEDPAEQKAIRTARQLRKEGGSLRSISRAMAHFGLKNRKGKPFHPTQVKRLIEE